MLLLFVSVLSICLMRSSSAFVIQYWIALTLVILSLVSDSSNAAWQASLTDTEIQALNVTAADHFRTAQQDTLLRANKVKPGNTQLGLEVLLVELQEAKNRATDAPRLAEIFLFDYASNTANIMLVEVESQRVIGSHQLNDIHLPLNEREVAAATGLLLDDATLMSNLASEYEKQVGKPLISLQQLDMKVSIWNPGSSERYPRDCSLTRCALVSLFTENYHNFSVEPIVNLSTGSINLDWVR